MESSPVWRYGARGHGVSSYPEWGLPLVTPDEIAAWVSRFFTRENAVLWVAGHLPAGLRLNLPTGVRQPVPAPTPAVPTMPAYYEGPNSATGLTAIVRRTQAARVYSAVLERKLFRSLRQEGGLSYTAATGYESNGDGTATVTALVDALPDKQDAVLGGFIDVLAEMRHGRIDESDVNAVKALGRQAMSEPDAEANRLPSVAFDLLAGEPLHSLDEMQANLEAITVADVHAVAKEAHQTSLLMVPEDRRADWAGYEGTSALSDSAVVGTAIPARGASEASLIFGRDGVTLAANGNNQTVRYGDCVAELIWPDGGRLLIGGDGVSVRVEPTLFAVDPQTIASIDANVLPDRRIPMPARDPGSIPQPRAVTPPPAPAAPQTSVPATSTGLKVSAAIFGFLGILAFLFALAVTLVPTDATIDTSTEVVTDVCFWVVAIPFFLPAFIVLRRSRRRRKAVA
jgi:hypothetical protein